MTWVKSDELGRIMQASTVLGNCLLGREEMSGEVCPFCGGGRDEHKPTRDVERALSALEELE